ncbi:hypothetical protein H5407_07050 [Mitsuaria sp. WAJ17]|uniref:hypothetical protein n=1 Tax=Mitsuaria sp. WAJ17 TaxID=2761452 RepID=UPI00160056E8|nr:hypothetical protein [Mitsuaria sp. WAJ17]MBB2484985.1 hypothetical protein [Mitsuaria sp. WAJ17]
MPAALVASVLASLTAAVALLLIVVLGRRARAGAGSWPEVGRALARRARRPLRWLMVVALLAAGVELLLPAQRISTEVYQMEVVEAGGVRLSYSVCCTGGGVDACVAPGGTTLRLGQPVELRRTRLLGRCTAQAMEGPPAPCHCS